MTQSFRMIEQRRDRPGDRDGVAGWHARGSSLKVTPTNLTAHQATGQQITRFLLAGAEEIAVIGVDFEALLGGGNF